MALTKQGTRDTGLETHEHRAQGTQSFSSSIEAQIYIEAPKVRVDCV